MEKLKELYSKTRAWVRMQPPEVVLLVGCALGALMDDPLLKLIGWIF